MELSKRLYAVASLVTEGASVADLSYERRNCFKGDCP